MSAIEIYKVYDNIRNAIHNLEADYKKLKLTSASRRQKTDLKKQIKQTRGQLTTIQSGLIDQQLIQKSYTRQSGRCMNERLMY